MIIIILLLQKRKEKGKIELKNVYVIETAILPNEDYNLTDNFGFAFQICYGESSQIYTLYLKATREQERTEWIKALRQGNYILIKNIQKFTLAINKILYIKMKFKENFTFI